MSDNPKEAEREMEKAIFISADCWLEVFDLLPPFQLGLGIALISHRFDRRVDEHFKTRKWTLNNMEIRRKMGTNEMEIINSKGKALSIPRNPLPNKVIGFRSIEIFFIDQNVLTFLDHFHRFFSACATKLYISTENVRILDFIVLNIWPCFKDTIRQLFLGRIAFRQIRQLAPSILCNCPCLQTVSLFSDIMLEFPPADDSANASDGQAVAKWLFTPRPDNNLPKMLKVENENSTVNQWLEAVEQIKAAFSSAFSPVAFIIYVHFPLWYSLSAVVPFELTNELTGEQLALSKEEDENAFKLIRCPIAAANGVKEWINEMKKKVVGRKKNKIGFFIGESGVDKRLLYAASAGPSGDQKQQK